MSKPKDKHYRTISPQFARKNFVQIVAGYVAAHKVEGATAVIDGDPADFFAGKQYKKEKATHFREQTGHNHDEISNGDFSERLQEGVSKIAPVVVFCFGESPYPETKHRYMVSFRHDEIEKVEVEEEKE